MATEKDLKDFSPLGLKTRREIAGDEWFDLKMDNMTEWDRYWQICATNTNCTSSKASRSHSAARGNACIECGNEGRHGGEAPLEFIQRPDKEFWLFQEP